MLGLLDQAGLPRKWKTEKKKKIEKEAHVIHGYCTGETSSRDTIEQRGLIHTEDVMAKCRTL